MRTKLQRRPNLQEIPVCTTIKKTPSISKKHLLHLSTNVKSNFVNTTSNLPTAYTKSYAQVTPKNSNIYSNIPSSTDSELVPLNLSSFLDDFKTLISPLIFLLTTLINSLITSKSDKQTSSYPLSISILFQNVNGLIQQQNKLKSLLT